MAASARFDRRLCGNSRSFASQYKKLLAYANEIESPVLLVHGEKAHSRYFSEGAFQKLKGDNKELLIVPGANHTDLYDNLEKIPFDRITNFYTQNLK